MPNTARDHASIPGLQSKRVLIVEDEARIRTRLSELFREWGARVREAATIADALPKLDPPPNLVVVDVRLPDGNGRAVVEACGLLEPAPLIVAMSGLASAREAFELARMGVDLFVPKPFTRATFEKRVRDIYGQEQATARQALSSELSEDTRRLLAERLRDFAAANALTESEEDLVRLAISGVPRKRFTEVLGVSENTCKTRIRRLLRKCDAAKLADIPRMLLLRDPRG